MSEKSLGRFSVGSTAEISHVITATDIERFADLTGDTNPVHVDRAFAERTPMKGTVAHGMLSASFISTMIGKHIPGDGSLWMTQTLEFLLPVRVGDQITVRATVTDLNPAHRTLNLATEVFNQHGQKVIDGRSLVKLLETTEPEVEAIPDAAFGDVAIVTGASRGIGAAVATRLAQLGFSVAVNYRSDAEGAAAVVAAIQSAGGVAAAFRADVTDQAQVTTMVQGVEQTFGPVTALVNNATQKLIPKPFAKVTGEELDSYWAVQVKAPLELIRLVLPHFARAKRGSVVNVSTIYTDGTPPPQLLAYTATKAAIESATKSLAVEYGPKGFRFNLVSPGMTETRLIAETPEKARLLTKMQTPLRRLAVPDDIANGICFLLGPDARHITGATLRICGGVVMM